jgi:hypothetical protein
MPSLHSQHDALATTAEPSPLYALHRGRVLRRTETGNIIVLVDGGERAMRCALSCLLVPEPGDLALIAGYETEAYILAVLERPGPAPAVLAAATPSGATHFAAQKLVLRAERDLEISAPRSHVTGERFTIAVEALSFVARLLTQTLGRWQSSAEKIDTVATDIATKAARRIAIVDETDMLEAGDLLQKIEAASVTNAQAVVIAAEEDLRLDGVRVTVG